MINSLHSNKLLFTVIFFTAFFASISFAEDEPIDIWEKNDTKDEKNKVIINEQTNSTQSLIISDNSNKTVVSVDQNEILSDNQTVIGLFDPEKNNFNLDMWKKTDGEEIKKVLKRIDQIKLSKLSEDLLFQVLFTNSYSPEKNLSSEEFLKIKIEWLIKRKRIEDLEDLLKTNPEVGKQTKAIKFLVNEYLSSANIKLACDKINFIDRIIQNTYLEKFKIYCLINNDRKEEAQLVFDLLKERGFEDKFFEDKINFLLGLKEQADQKILDDNLLNFYFSHITNKNFIYEPNEKTDKYIWKYLTSANLIKVSDFENESVIRTYEEAAAEGSFDSDEIFKIYLKMNFNFNQLSNSEEIYKNLPNYKARALIYQSMMLNDDINKKIIFAFLLKDLFIKDNLLNIYVGELSDVLNSINPDVIPENYSELVEQNIEGKIEKKVKFDNDILHRSKVIKYFIDDNVELSKTEKDFKSVYKKIKKNKKYFISIKDIVVLDALIADGFSIPADLKYNDLASQLTIPKNLQTLASQNQIGLVMLKIVEIIGEDKISDLDPETIYFLNRILNDLELKKIRNSILSVALPIRI